MKASDICVGDWLNIYTFPNDNPKQDDLFPAKVSAVSVFDLLFDPDDVVVELVIPNTNGIASRPLDTCLPIKLTEEILVKNGFALDKSLAEIGMKVYTRPCPAGDLSVKVFHDGSIRFGFIKLTYVHQLQHLLRLCGIEKEIEL